MKCTITMVAFVMVAVVSIVLVATHEAAKSNNLVSVGVFGSPERAINVVPDKSGGHIDFTVVNRFDHERVVFVDKGFDGTLDEVDTYDTHGRVSESGAIFFYPGNTAPLTDGEKLWLQRFLDVRKEAAASD